MKKLLYTQFLLLILISNYSCYSQIEDFDYGDINNGIYRNDFFKMEIAIPAGWSVQTKEQMDHMSDIGKEIIAGDDKIIKGAIKASEVNVANLFAAFKYELGSPVDYNAGIALIAENISNYPGIKSGHDYLYQSRKLLERTPLDFKHISNEFEKETFSGTEFYKMVVEINYGGLELTQFYYSAVMNGFSLNFIISFINNEEKKELLNSLSTLKFN